MLDHIDAELHSKLCRTVGTGVVDKKDAVNLRPRNLCDHVTHRLRRPVGGQDNDALPTASDWPWGCDPHRFWRTRQDQQREQPDRFQKHGWPGSPGCPGEEQVDIAEDHQHRHPDRRPEPKDKPGANEQVACHVVDVQVRGDEAGPDERRRDH